MTKTYNVFTGDGDTIATEATMAAMAAAITGSSFTGSGPAGSGSLTTLANEQDTGNTNLSTLASGSTWSGSWRDTTGYSQIVTNFRSDKSGSFYMEFSSDGITTDRSLGPYVLSPNTDSPQPLAPIRKFYRAKFTNTTSDTANLRIETRLSSVPGLFQTRIQDGLTNLSTTTLNRSVLFGRDDNGVTFRNVGITQGNALRMHMDDPVDAFGNMMTSELESKIQIDAVYGINLADHEPFSGSSGTVTSSGSMFLCKTGTSVGGYGVIRSRRLVRYRPGQGVRARLTALFETSASNSLQLAGLFSATEAIAVGYSGSTFGVHRRIAGTAAVMRLTLTAGPTSPETLTVRLNNTNFNVAVVSGSTASAAEQIARSGSVFTGWYSSVSPTSNASTVTFIQGTPAAVTGTFSITSTGATTGSFATIQSGSANDDDTGFIPQSQWNIDRLDGSNGEYNPSGITLDPTKLNIYEFRIPYLGGGPITYSIRTNRGHQEIHTVEYVNANTVPSMKNPTLRAGWIAASLGSTTDLTVKGASAAAFIEGRTTRPRDPYGAAVNGFSAGTTEYLALAIRNGAIFNGVINLKEIIPAIISVGTETSNRIIRVRLVLNPTFSGNVGWTYSDSTRTVAEIATPGASAAITATGGYDVGYGIAASGAPSSLTYAEKNEVKLEPGDVLAIMLQTASGTAVTTATINWAEV